MNNFVDLLTSIGESEPHAAEKLLPILYDELRVLAKNYMAKESPGHTLGTTALVHEA